MATRGLRPAPAHLLFAVVLLAAGVAYWPGLSGAFLFDDFANLPALGRYGGVRDWDTLTWYLTSGIADPTGRPVALLSFLLDARDWPADPWPFKRTGLLLHLGNGLLLLAVLVALGRRLDADMHRVRMAALLAASLWMLHPLWASTVLYVVQRQAMLAACFVLCGIRAWIAAVDAFRGGRHRRGWLFALLAVPVCGLLAGLSKANGFLLPLLLVVLHLTVLRAPDRPRAERIATAALAWLPAMLVVAWLAWTALDTGLDGRAGRAWTLDERLMSQPRALWDYLHQLFVPGLDATGVFADGFAVSRSWTDPATTLPAMVGLAALVAVACALHRRRPVLAAAVGFFLAGHAMESSVVMLELYFEHRNYLPSMLLFWTLAWACTAPSAHRRWWIAGLAAHAALFLLATAVQARLWADPLALARAWAMQNPLSARAQANAALAERAAGQPDAADARLDALARRSPHEPQYVLNLLDLRCATRRATQADVDRSIVALRNGGGLALDMSYHWLVRTVTPGSGAACSALPDGQMRRLHAAALAGLTPEPSIETQSRTRNLSARLVMREGRCADALADFDVRNRLQPRPEFVQEQVGLLATRCGAGTALRHLDRYLDAGAPAARAPNAALRLRDLLMRDFWARYWAGMRVTLREEAASAPPGGSGTAGTTPTPGR